MNVTIQMTEEQQELIVIEELKEAYKLNYEQDPGYQDEELLHALCVVLEYFMGVAAYNEWKNA